MPWPFLIPEFLKRRACRYLLHHYLGQYLGEKISLDDLSIDLYNGTGSVSNVPLDVEVKEPYIGQPLYRIGTCNMTYISD